jgi:predicted nucleotidyltransferase
MKRAEVLRILREHYPELKKRYKIANLFLFGSVARDEARPDSDVDILVEFAESSGLFEFIELQQTLEHLLGCKVDLGTPRSLKAHLKEDALKDAIPVT